jgi:2-dehydropantoate 2-reductase
VSGAAERIGVVGPGAVGGFFAAHLAALGHDVLSCARRPFYEYIVESTIAPVRAPARVVVDSAELDGASPCDWVFVGVKAHQTVGAVPWLERLCGPATTVVVMQNGVEGVERLAPLVRGAEVIPSVVYCGAELVAPGHVEHHNAGTLIVADSEAAQRLASLFEGSAARIKIVEPSEEYPTAAWRKLGINVMANGITALTRRRMDVLQRPDVAALTHHLLDECWAVARAEGAALSADDATAFIEGIGRLPGDAGTSMLHDRLAGRPTEHDALYGAVIRAGRRHDIATPYAAAIAALLAAGDPS